MRTHAFRRDLVLLATFPGRTIGVAIMSRTIMSRRTFLGGVALSTFAGAPGVLRAQTPQISVGFVTAQTGPGASVGIPYGLGINAAIGHIDNIAGHKIRCIQMDDGS